MFTTYQSMYMQHVHTTYQSMYIQLILQVFGKPMEKDKRMTTARCAELMGVAIANKLNETWITIQPILLFTYGGQYMPTIAKR